LTTALLLSSALFASSDELVEDFLEESFSNNPALISVDVKVADRVPLEDLKGWDALIVNVDAKVKAKPKPREVKQKMIWFTNGTVITKELTNMKTLESLRDTVNPKFKPHHYKKENLIYGNENAKHKVAIFSDPLCPFCSTYVPNAINYMKKYPNKFAIYYYHFPLPSIHPAAVELSQAAIAAELQGRKNVVLDMYKVKINPKERDVKKILAAFNKTMGTNLKPTDIGSPKVVEHFKSDLAVADDVMVQGTPTMFFDGTIDKTKRKYQKVK
jgi:thiol-disulfide isomerase/thioredoxin